jgi:transmembrane sensor
LIRVTAAGCRGFRGWAVYTPIPHLARMSDDLDWKVLDRYLAGDASPAEAANARAWLAASPERRQLADALSDRSTPRAVVDVDAAWQRVASRTVEGPSRRQALRRRVVAWRATPWLAAAAIVVIAVSITVQRGQDRAPSPRTTIAHSTWREIETPRGSHVAIDLPDGSTVKLNAGSRLRFDSTGRGRDVYLRGEGYFVVKHNASRPFVVHANGASIRDVGTRFVVRAYDGEAGTMVVVAEGAVSLRRDVADISDSVTATEGMLARLTSSGSLATATVDPSRYLAFTDGRLVLDGVTLATALPMIERWYDVDIKLADSLLATRQVTAEFHGETASEAMRALSIALDLDVSANGKSFVIGARKGQL